MSQQPPESPTIGELGYEVVDHLLHPVAAMVRNLLSPRDSTEPQSFIIDDEENILEALRAGLCLDMVLFSGEQALPEPIVSALAPQQTPIYEVARRTCKKLFDKERASRLFAVAKIPRPRSLASLADIQKDFVVLDHLTIQGNIGAIIRNAIAFEIGAVILLGAETKSIYDRRLVRASRGYVFSLPIVGASSQEFLDFAKANELAVAVTDANANTSVDELGPKAHPRRIAMVMGSEKHGCSPEIVNHATMSVSIPMNLQVESLNVSAACAIMMHRRYAFNAQAPA